MEPMETEYSNPDGYFSEGFGPNFISRLREARPRLKAALENHGLYFTSSLAAGYVTVSTTTETKDPDIIDRARECIILILNTSVRSSGYAIKVMNGELHHLYIETGYQENGLCTIHGIKLERFVKQRNRLAKHLKDFADLLGGTLFVDRESATSVGTSREHVMVFRTIVNRCIVANVNPAALVKAMQQHVSEVRMEQKLEALHI